ncbi:ead/Ea22-like family protein [Edwardsiella anguillarum]|uniref:Ead/Ea22-like family protein n=1 Tax=Edwardsiella anguillarum TaxID=1821960 RepID=A0ABY8SLN8_9GAMM|nr:ead/Ea22-like family protein [Edwardsiella anguillarum]WHP85857.1 ead/Ea22-like family protein [Edwardsiella anguillarum]WHP89653.1 ead/Ea22-like family protein [Edwardsiella anguillarum]WHP93451.1 ead/Ea22-like family protein [Edwardsiella anguillarum]WHP97251.1 ead/Ea22-like family protein [Edwardsiella anguillarum]WHQ01108.1 ead/Ea22-like family protein [Edwardsiella anguillarum]
MSKQIEKIVMMDSDEAARIQTVTGWVDRHGRFWGNDEYQARWSGSTHRKCKNKPDVHPAHSTHGYCEECHREARQAKFLAMERVAWSGEPLTIFDSDKYFFDAESLADYCVENSLLPSELQLVICEPNYPPEFDIEQHCEEIIPEGGDYFSLPQTVRDAADALNKAIKESEPVSWSGSERSAIVSDDILTDEQGGACSMSQVDKQALREAALNAKTAGEAQVMPFDQRIDALNAFTKLLTPATVIALLDGNEALAAENADLKHPGTYLPSKISTTETDAFINEMMAQGVEMLARKCGENAWCEDDVNFMICYAKQLREDKE